MCEMCKALGNDEAIIDSAARLEAAGLSNEEVLAGVRSKMDQGYEGYRTKVNEKVEELAALFRENPNADVTDVFIFGLVALYGLGDKDAEPLSQMAAMMLAVTAMIEAGRFKAGVDNLPPMTVMTGERS